MFKKASLILIVVTVITVSNLGYTQDIEPRRWTPLPLDSHVIALGYGRSFGDIAFDPVMEIDNAHTDIDTMVLSYVQPFKFAGKLARVDALVPFQRGYWQGLLQGEHASTTRRGLADPRLRLSLNLAGSPPVDAKGLRQYFKNRPVNTQVGIALAATLPLGQYHSEKLLNLGQNRLTLQPQIGVLHSRGPWSYELTASVFFFSDNTDFYNGNTRKQNTLTALQAHLIRRFEKGKWLSISVGNGLGGETSINGIQKEDHRNDMAYALSLGLPVFKSQSIKFSFIHGETHKRTGADIDTVAVSWAKMY